MDKDLEAIQEVRMLVEQAHTAAQELARYSQAEVDAVVRAMAEAAFQNARRLAQAAVDDTGMGVVEDKVTKNVFGSWYIYDFIKDMKTVGVIREFPEKKVVEIAEPMGVIVGIIPTTNPTSTVMNKALISVKARNALVMSPHPRAVGCVQETTQVMYDAAVQAGAPEHIIACLSRPNIAATTELMGHRDVALILATGGAAMVRAAYSAGKPAYGVGPGNVPAGIERSADVRKAVRDILTSKTFDNGTLCTSEQAIIVEDVVKEAVVRELVARHAYFADNAEVTKLEAVIVGSGGGINPAVVGQSTGRIAEMAGIGIPTDTSVIVVPLRGVGRDFPLSLEKMSPVIAFYVEPDHEAIARRAKQVVEYGGLGHTAVIHSNNEEAIQHFAQTVPAFRILVNTPADHGGVGMTTGLTPSMTLGSGTISGCITTEHINPMHLVNVKRLAYETRPLDRVPLKSADEAFDLYPGGGTRPAHRVQARHRWDDPLPRPGRRIVREAASPMDRERQVQEIVQSYDRSRR